MKRNRQAGGRLQVEKIGHKDTLYADASCPFQTEFYFTICDSSPAL